MKRLKNIFIPCCLALLTFACSKGYETTTDSPTDVAGFDTIKSFEEQIMSIPNNTLPSKELISEYSQIMAEVLTMSKEQDFRELVYENVLEANSRDEDYVLGLNTMVKKLRTSSKFAKSSAKIESLIARVSALHPEDSPMVFYPKAETLEDAALANKGFDVSKSMNEPIVVLKGAYNDDYSVPGYKMGADGNLVFDRMVTEEDAWENDVYVIGAMENVDMTKSNVITTIDDEWGDGGSGGGGGSSSSNFRIDGRVEKGGAIQVLALNEIEHWTAGKLEFRLIVSGLRNSGGTITNDLKFPKIKRKHFKDEKWYDYNIFLFNWNLTTIADYNIEKWMERDNGLYESTLEISIPGTAFKPATSTTPAQPALPGTKVSIKYRTGDEDLGTSLVQFGDKINKIYNLGQANFRRK